MIISKFIVNLYLKLAFIYHKWCCRPVKKRKVSSVYIIYRISDCGYPKEKLAFVNNENCLKNAISRFPLDKCSWLIIADNISDETYKMMLKYVSAENIWRVSIGNGAGTFRLAYEKAMSLTKNTLVYFLENDYIHRKGALEALLEAAECSESEYITLYDNPDKYGYGNLNPFVKGGEKTRVFLTRSTHWKFTNSTTMTFATFVDNLFRDKKIFWKWTNTKHPYDFDIFIELGLKNRKLMCPIPGYSTHGDIEYVTPIIDWKKEITQ
ncbi:hypothetical protein [uncultured Parabacteroides sp.]|uniref:hypothetical protein n=1 Tax=uncultured Parabacteroides sp. TaxID=512312 RepID=UPI0026062397|nr:hypothetical protein [uncultured Parabacteroides sp.]